jgi:hypothetical protein
MMSRNHGVSRLLNVTLASALQKVAVHLQPTPDCLPLTP